jgi:predicted nucleotidyltransferase component of viral defense system
MSKDALQFIRSCPFDKNSLELLARKTGSGRSAIEKDFVISALFIILASSLSFSRYTKRMSFSGGTCLKKVFYPGEMRFSEDLDFSGLTPAECSGFHTTMNELTGKDFGATSFTDTRVQYENERGLDFLVFYTSVLRQKNHIAFNLSTAKAMKKAKNMDVHVEPYFTSLHPAILTMSIDEIIAEKVRALLQRTKPRDVFDV